LIFFYGSYAPSYLNWWLTDHSLFSSEKFVLQRSWPVMTDWDHAFGILCIWWNFEIMVYLYSYNMGPRSIFFQQCRVQVN
jgi:hypothetical protein